MEDMKAQVELKLIAAQLSDWCRHKEGIIFKPSLCTQERILRFQTPLLTEIFPNSEKEAGVWRNGRFLMYEIYNGLDLFKITCSISQTGLSKKERKACEKLIKSCNAQTEERKGLLFLKEWSYPEAARNLEKIFEAVNDFSEYELPYFETELIKWINDQDYVIKPFPDVSQILLSKEELPEELLIEGSMKDILTNKYERNMSARKKCIAVHGTSCSICGFDFGAVYGLEFSGKIHVHHRVPLYEIKEGYIVDPVNDLVPVCPNCHMILHSKADGYFTVEEVKELFQRRK